jgi:hypothetical protein
MSFDINGPLRELVALLEGTSMVSAGLQHVYVGVPESLASKLSAYVYFRKYPPTNKTNDLLQRKVDYYILFGYRVSNDEAGAEFALGDVLDAFDSAFYALRAGGLNGKVADCGEAQIGEREEYEVYAGQEFRSHPVRIETTQYQIV